MSNSKWSKRWLYDSTVGVPKTTRWRRRLNFNNPPLEENVTVDNVHSEFTSEVIKDLDHTSPFKRRKLLGSCLCDENSEADHEKDPNEDDYGELGYAGEWFCELSEYLL